MKHIMTSLLCSFALIVSAVQFEQGARIVNVGGVPARAEKLEIVLPAETPLLKFAAAELQTFLEQATGRKPPVVKEPHADSVSLILGDNVYAVKAGLKVSALPEQGYFIRRIGSRIYLAGKDSATDAPSQNRWAQCYRRGTLSAVYDFLERFADARFFFPGEMGTIIPAKGALMLPPVIDILERPDFTDRRFLHYDGKWYEGDGSYGGVKGINLNLLRLRMTENIIPFGHGLAYMDYLRRFKDHPEYFALMPDGRRHNDEGFVHTGHLCFNSGIREEIYQDAKTYLTGGSAQSRGLGHWNFNAARPGYFSLMTQDWLYWCGCEKCRRISPPGRDEAYKENRQAVSDFMWQFTADLANRLKKEGVPGIITQMAYLPYDKIPKCDIPQNVAVQVAVTGPGKNDQKADDEKIKAWVGKLKSKVSLWTYPGKCGNKAMPGIPAMMHHHMGKYFQDRRDWLFGAFIESETDHYIFNYLNYYIFAKATWNTDTDLNAVLDDHYRVMFGKGAPMMQKFYDELEALWVNRIAGNTVDTALGPVATLPTDIEIWTKIYSPEKLKEFERLFKNAEAAAGKDADALKRIRFMKKNMLEPVLAAAEKFRKSQNSLDSWKVDLPGTVYLRAYKGDVNEVSTAVRITRDQDYLIFTFLCEEPRMADIKAVQHGKDAPLTFEDSCVELFLNPSGDRKNYYHLVVNANGALADYSNQVNAPSNLKWDSGAEVRAKKLAGAWEAVVKVPWSALGNYDKEGFPVNFARHRALNGTPAKEIYYQWSPLPGRSFHALERYGRLMLKKQPDAGVIADPDFQVERKGRYQAGKWLLWTSDEPEKGQSFELDNRIFMTGGKSLHLKNVRGKRMSAGQKIPALEPDTKYRLSYFIKTENLQSPGGAGAFLYFTKVKGKAFPGTQLAGTHPWHRLTFEFVTPPDTGKDAVPVLGLWIWNAQGDAWFDDVRLEKVK